jgi:signal transduction histidine kinase
VVRDVTERVHAYQLLEARVAERTREIERRREVAEGLRELLAAVNSRRTLDEVLDAVVAQTGRLLGSDAGAIYLPDGPPSDGLLAARAAQGLEPEAVTRKLHVGRPMTGLAFSMRRPVVASDLLAIIPDDHVHIPEPELAEHVGYVEVLREPAHLDPVGTASVRRLAASYRAILAVPLVARDDTYGVLTLYFRRPRAFDDEEVRLATAFADQAALALENARLSEQAQQAAALEERQRLARELHDAVTQTLFSTALIADVLPDLWDLDQVEARRSLENLRRLTRGALAEMRTLLVELRPGALVELPLGDLLRQLAEATAGRSRVEVTARVEGEQQRPLPPEVQVALYRIAQEALSNAVKHAQARHATLILHQWATGGLSLAVEDDGRGFDATSIPAGHLGVGIMRERAAAVGAGFSIESSPGQGTRVSVQWRGDQAETA